MYLRGRTKKYYPGNTPRKNDVVCLDMSILTPEWGSCFFCKASQSVNWLWHKRLSRLNFKNINKLAKQNKVLGLPSLVYSKDKPCTACEKGKHHRASFKTSLSGSVCIIFIWTCLDQCETVSPHTKDFTTSEKLCSVVIAPNEPNIPHTKDTKGPPDLIKHLRDT
ncbi:retrovirus-related pol polyprotein from transposon TNT 1-94 [Tanacetum coccineum]